MNTQVNNKKNKRTPTFDLPVPKSLVRPFVGKTQLERLVREYPRVAMQLFPPGYLFTGEHEWADSYILRLTSRRKDILNDATTAVVMRYNKIVTVINNIIKSRHIAGEENSCCHEELCGEHCGEHCGVEASDSSSLD